MAGILNWAFDLVENAGNAYNVITTPFIDFGNGDSYTILALLTYGGLMAYLVFALVKWIVN